VGVYRVRRHVTVIHIKHSHLLVLATLFICCLLALANKLLSIICHYHWLIDAIAGALDEFVIMLLISKSLTLVTLPVNITIILRVKIIDHVHLSRFFLDFFQEFTETYLMIVLLVHLLLLLI
jgi:hypothetical protein